MPKMSLSRQAGKNLVRSVGVYENVEHMVQRAVDKTKPTLVKSLPKNRENLYKAFEDLYIDFKAYKRDLGVTDGELDKSDEEGKPAYEYNNVWFEKLREEYYGLIDLTDEKLNEVSTSASKADLNVLESKVETEASEIKALQNKRLSSQLYKQVEALSKSITESINKYQAEVNIMEDGSVNISKVDSFKKDLANLDEKVDIRLHDLCNQYFCLLSDTEIEEKEKDLDVFVKKFKSQYNDLLILLNKKVKDAISHTSVEKKTDHTHLKKIEPPSFKGDIVEYADFVRKWKAQVSKAGLSSESELDRLRDNVPTQASKALYGESSMDSAWKVLDKLYGDTDLVANKLKVQLKNIKPKGKVQF